MRRPFVNKIWISVISIIFYCCDQSAVAQIARPNVIFILSDDQGASDLRAGLVTHDWQLNNGSRIDGTA
jgi:hypothetical protein